MRKMNPRMETIRAKKEKEIQRMVLEMGLQMKRRVAMRKRRVVKGHL